MRFITNIIRITGLLICCMVMYWAFLESQPALGNIPANLHLTVIFGLILLMYFTLRKDVRGLMLEIGFIVNRFMPGSPRSRKAIRKPVIWVIILNSKICCLVCLVLMVCSLINRDYYVIESPGWVLFVPMFLAVSAIKVVRAYRMRNSLFWGLFFSVFAWLLVVGYIQAYLDYIYPEDFFCLA